MTARGAQQTKRTAARTRPGGSADHRLAPVDAVGCAVLSLLVLLRLIDLSSAFAEVPVQGAADVVIITGSAVAIALLVRHQRRGWMLAAAIAVAELATLAVGRADHVRALEFLSSWSSQLQVGSGALEIALLSLAVPALRMRLHDGPDHPDRSDERRR